MQDLSLVAKLRHKGFPIVFIAPIEACKTATTLYSPSPSIFKHGSLFQSVIHFLAAFPYVSTDPSFCCYAFSEAVHDSRKHPPGLTASNLLPQQFKPPNPSHLHQSLPTFSLRSLPSRAALKTTFLNSRPVAAILKSFKFDSLTSSRPQNPSLRSKLC